MKRLNREATLGAFADDISVVLRQLMKGLRRLQKMFLELERVAGFSLNITKTVVVPLGDNPLAETQRAISMACPGWAGIPVKGSAVYLGFTMGPDRGTKSWKGPLEKVTTRAEQWSSTALGLQLAAAAYTTYIMSTCTFIAQLDSGGTQGHEETRSGTRQLVHRT